VGRGPAPPPGYCAAARRLRPARLRAQGAPGVAQAPGGFLKGALGAAAGVAGGVLLADGIRGLFHGGGGIAGGLGNRFGFQHTGLGGETIVNNIMAILPTPARKTQATTRRMTTTPLARRTPTIEPDDGYEQRWRRRCSTSDGNFVEEGGTRRRVPLIRSPREGLRQRPRRFLQRRLVSQAKVYCL